MTITEFLLARISEDEDAAQRGRSHPDPSIFARDNYGYLWVQPARVLAECEAKRRIVAQYDELRSHVVAFRSPRWADAMNERDRQELGKSEARHRVAEDMVRALASVHADHPDFDPAWRA